MTDQPMLSISVNDLTIYRDYLRAALHLLPNPDRDQPPSTDLAIRLIQRVHTFLIEDIHETLSHPDPFPPLNAPQDRKESES